MNEPLVSVVIPAYNAEKYIGRCLESLHAQTYKNWEAIIVVAPSKDNTLSEISKCASEKIKVILETRKSNCATARNIGYAAGKGAYVYFIDADDWLEPDCFKTLIKTFETSDPSTMWCVSSRMGYNGDTTYLIDKCPGTDSSIGGIGGTLFKRCCLERVVKKYGYLFDTSLNHTDDGDLVLRTRHYPHVMIQTVLSAYMWNTEGLTAQTHWFEQAFGIGKMMVKRGAWDLLPDHLYNTSIQCVNETFGIDLVKIKKGLLS